MKFEDKAERIGRLCLILMSAQMAAVHLGDFNEWLTENLIEERSCSDSDI